MTSLFSNFDLYFFKVTFMVFFWICLMILTNFFKKNFNLSLVSLSILKMEELMYTFTPLRSSQGKISVILCLFVGFIFFNLFSVNPFNFPLSSQVSTVLFVGFSFWLSMITFSFFKNFLGNLAHLIPEGAPIYMAVLLLVIEFVSLIIRPITLSVRMMANILAGHLLMILLSKLVFIMGSASILYIGLNLVEMFVACIQSYIFMVMIILYYTDVN